MSAVVYYPLFRYALADGTPGVGYKLYTYTAGTDTPLPTYTDNSLGTENPNPTELNANGEFVGFPPDGAVYKLVLKTPADVPVWTIDFVTFGGEAVTPLNQWVDSEQTPTYLSATSFSVPTDQRALFYPGQRLLSDNSGGSILSTVVGSSFAAAVTTVVVTNDSSSLDSSMSNLRYGLLQSNELAFPITSNLSTNLVSISTPSASTTIVNSGTSALGDRMTEYTSATGRFTAKVTGNYLARISGYLGQNGANVAYGAAFAATLYKNGSTTSAGLAATWPFDTGAAANVLPIAMALPIALTAGDYIDWRVTTPTTTTATMFANTTMQVIRLP